MSAQESTIELWLSTPQQLFNSFDPSPFHEKDLDRDAEEYIFGSADEFPLPQPVRMVVHLPTDQAAKLENTAIETAIRNYFEYRLTETGRRMRFHFREGRAALLIGLGFLIACMIVRELAPILVPGTIGRILQEGLLILGWVAMWRPLQVFLYDWWPIKHHARLFAKLAAMPVEIRAAPRPAKEVVP